MCVEVVIAREITTRGGGYEAHSSHDVEEEEVRVDARQYWIVAGRVEVRRLMARSRYTVWSYRVWAVR